MVLLLDEASVNPDDLSFFSSLVTLLGTLSCVRWTGVARCSAKPGVRRSVVGVRRARFLVVIVDAVEVASDDAEASSADA